MSAATSTIDPAAVAADRTNPFPGLRPFREDEESLFFGRESQVDAMVDKLGRHAFPQRRRHLGQRQVLARQLRPAAGPAPRA